MRADYMGCVHAVGAGDGGLPRDPSMAERIGSTALYSRAHAGSWTVVQFHRLHVGKHHLDPGWCLQCIRKVGRGGWAHMVPSG